MSFYWILFWTSLREISDSFQAINIKAANEPTLSRDASGQVT